MLANALQAIEETVRPNVYLSLQVSGHASHGYPKVKNPSKMVTSYDWVTWSDLQKHLDVARYVHILQTKTSNPTITKSGHDRPRALGASIRPAAVKSLLCKAGSTRPFLSLKIVRIHKRRSALTFLAFLLNDVVN